MWYHTRGSLGRSLSLISGQTSIILYKWLKFGRKVLLACLIQDIDAKIEFPTMAEVCMYQDTIGIKYPYVGMAWTASFKMDFQQAGIDRIQNLFFLIYGHMGTMLTLCLCLPPMEKYVSA